ncbi:MAG: SGNH/GDSL hydrolase family protein [Lachnospiraceae bacterium]|nr:SGNH/GDSL hydrolase family protein [Lachnospiraceae bacterium]
MKKFLKYFLSTIVVLMTLFFLQELLVPKYVTDLPEGSMISEYYDEERMDHDVIFIGDCEIYENYSPITMWEEYGINSYLRGTSQQCMWQTYGVLEDTLKYETPKAVVVNVMSMRFNEPQSEAYNRMTLEGMRWSKTKVDTIKASMMKNETFISYVFPMLRYHERIWELTEEDFEYYLKSDKVVHNGYLMRVDIRPVDYIPTAKPLGDYSFGENAWLYLDKIRETCEAKGVELILVKAPSVYPHWYDEWDENIVQYAAEHGLSYYNLYYVADEIGIDYQVDTFDEGLHMNLTGAEKVARYFGRILQEEHGIPDRRGEEELSRIWEEKIAFYEADRIAKEAAWEEEQKREEE